MPDELFLVYRNKAARSYISSDSMKTLPLSIGKPVGSGCFTLRW
jgi:hypothetical protein